MCVCFKGDYISVPKLKAMSLSVPPNVSIKQGHRNWSARGAREPSISWEKGPKLIPNFAFPWLLIVMHTLISAVCYVPVLGSASDLCLESINQGISNYQIQSL